MFNKKTTKKKKIIKKKRGGANELGMKCDVVLNKEYTCSLYMGKAILGVHLYMFYICFIYVIL